MSAPEKNLDQEMMARALELGHSGDPSPNPHVGCVIANGSQIIAEGYHKEAGSAHAEANALEAAGADAKGATLYVTLSPCNHQGRTPPCVDAIINAEIARVVIGCEDPNPKVPGGAIERLEAAGIEVTRGVREQQARALIRPWAKYITHGTSYLSLKLGISLDGRIASKTGASKWITCPESRARAHALRASHDAVCVGVQTVVMDDPRLTVRDAPGRSPIRVVVDSKLRIPLDSALVSSARDVPTCVVTTEEGSPAIAEELQARGVNIIRVATGNQGRCDMAATLRALAAREVVSVLCEGGAELAGSLLVGKLVDEVHLFMAPIVLGPRGRPWAVDWAGPDSPEEAPRIEHPTWELCGTDAYVSGPIMFPRKKPKTPPPA